MNLEQRYNTAAANTYAGRVRTTQASQVGARKGVDFMDAGAKALGAPDTMQSNFERRAEDDKVVTQGGDETKTYTASDRKGSSRWFGRALNYAFTDPSARSQGIEFSQYNTYKGLRPGTKDTWSDNPSNFHRWTPLQKFEAATVLSALAKLRATGKKPA